jgi:phage host-nuclease inhibitor protein Gam
MAKTTRIKSPAAKYPPPQTRDQVIDAVAEIGRRQRECQRIEAAMNDELAAVKARFETEATPHAEAIKAISGGVQTWCEANRQILTDGGRTKTAMLPTGEIKWRMTPPRVEIKGQEAVMDLLRRAGLARFIRFREEINKEAILVDPDAVKGIGGIKIKQTEEFVIQPFEADLQAGGAA